MNVEPITFQHHLQSVECENRSQTLYYDHMSIAPTTPTPASLSSSSLRWKLLKRAIAPSSAATDQKTGSGAVGASSTSTTDVSVRRHRGFRVLQCDPLNEQELQDLNLNLPFSSPSSTAGPGDNDSKSAIDHRSYQYVRYQLPIRSVSNTNADSSSLASSTVVAASTATAAAAPASSSSPPTLLPLYFRIRRSSSVRLSELAPDQRIDNTGNICIWNSEEVLTYLARKIRYQQHEDTTNTTKIKSPLSIPRPRPHLSFASTHPSTVASPPDSPPPRPLRILELGAGMSGLCGLALAKGGFDSTTNSDRCSNVPQIGEVVITDGNRACIDDGVAYQIEWNERIHATAVASPKVTSSSSSAASSASASASIPEASPAPPRISASVLEWNRSADYSTLGRFDIILAADCLFFRDYHIDLCHVLCSLLVPATGRAFLLAPSRGGSLQQFVDTIQQQQHPHVEASPSSSSPPPPSSAANTISDLATSVRIQLPSQLHVVSLSDRYDEEITRQHELFLREAQNIDATAAAATTNVASNAPAHASATSSSSPSSSFYSVDLHYPLLLTLKLQ